jgi:hypothetical protein
MQLKERSSWGTHDFKVKMLDWSAFHGSRLGDTCRRCGRKFCHFTVLKQGTWAVDGESRALENAVTGRWLSQDCPRYQSAADDEDRKRLREPVSQ